LPSLGCGQPGFSLPKWPRLRGAGHLSRVKRRRFAHLAMVAPCPLDRPRSCGLHEPCRIHRSREGGSYPSEAGSPRGLPRAIEPDLPPERRQDAAHVGNVLCKDPSPRRTPGDCDAAEPPDADRRERFVNPGRHGPWDGPLIRSPRACARGFHPTECGGDKQQAAAVPSTAATGPQRALGEMAWATPVHCRKPRRTVDFAHRHRDQL
jgi:hypothetical protein